MDRDNPIAKLASTLQILYVEDEEMVRDSFCRYFSRYFKYVDVAVDGEDGLSKVKAKNYDIIITDIQMPKMNGIEMIKKIKEIQPSARFIVATAFSDTRYFIDSISLKVDKYIIKPIDFSELSTAVYDITKNIDNEKRLELYAAKEVQEKINKATSNLIEQIININPHPVVVLDEAKKVVFINDEFKNLFSVDELNEIHNGHKSVDDYIVKHETHSKNHCKIKKVIIKGQNGSKRIFSMYIDTLKKYESRGVYTVYTFSDITLLEYQRNKAELYSHTLRDLLLLRHVNVDSAYTDCVDKATAKPAMLASKKEQEILQKKREQKNTIVSAKEYLDASTIDMDEIISAMLKVEDTLAGLIFGLKLDDSKSIMSKISMEFRKYSALLSNMSEFEEMYFAIHGLAEFLEGLEDEKIARYHDRLLSDINIIVKDLQEWRGSVFVNKNALNIHYFDDSILNACFQLQLDCNFGADGFFQMFQQDDE